MGSRSSRNSALATGTTRSWRPLMIVTGVVICGSSSASCGQLLGVACGRSASTRRSGRRRSRRGSPRGCRRGCRPRSCPGDVLTITRGSIWRYLSRSGSSTHERSGSPSSSGTAAPPVPTITLAMPLRMRRRREQGGRASRRRARRCAAVPRSASAMSRARNPPIARGDRRSSRRSDAPNPGRSTANRRACSASVAHIRANAYRLSGQGLVSSTIGSCEPPLSAYRIFSPSIVRNCGSIDAVSEVVMTAPLASRCVCAQVGSSVPACSATM